MQKHISSLDSSTAEAITSRLKPLRPEQANRSFWHSPSVHILLILVTGFAVYLNSMSAPFMFDDFSYLLNNPAIKSFDCFPHTKRVLSYWIQPDLKNNLILRPLAYFSFALNYHFHGFELFGYHLINLLLHLASSLLVYLLAASTVRIQLLSNGENNDDDYEYEILPYYIALFSALLFVCHPLQTQSVTYIIQRFVPMATFFYLAALVLYIRFRSTSAPTTRILTYILSLAAALLAMESKEIAFTLPVIMVLFEFMFFSGKIAPRIAMMMPFLLTMAIIPAKLVHLQSTVQLDQSNKIFNAINLVNFGGLSSWDYLMTQFGVITTYIRLLFMPIGQNFDYDYPLQQNFFTPEVLQPLLLLLMIAGAGIYLLNCSSQNRLYKIIAFGIFWFFITLSVESSIVPIEDLIFEHRAYLPSIGFFLAVLTGVTVIFNRLTGKMITSSKIMTLLLVAIVIILSTATITRNMLWQNEVSFLSDVVSKSPKKARLHQILGEALFAMGEIDGKNYDLARNEFLESARLDPTVHGSHRYLAEIYKREGNIEAAIKELELVIQIYPDKFIRNKLEDLKNR